MNNILLLGIVLTGGFLGAFLMSKIKIPAVTGYILVGLALGVSFLHIIPLQKNIALSWLINLALLLIAFNVGSELTLKNLTKFGKFIGPVVIFESLFSFIAIFLFLLLFKMDFKLALIIASLGSATAPAATVLVLNELRARGPLSTTILACVGLDDAIGITLFSISASIVSSMIGGPIHPGIVVLSIFVDLIASSIIGILAGLLLVYLVRTVSVDVQLVILITGFIFLFAGPLYYEFHSFHFSPLLASMFMGFIFATFSKKMKSARRPLDYFGYPFYLIYFVLAGARLQVKLLIKLGWFAIAYIIGRLTGKFVGAYIGGVVGKAPKVVRKYTGFGLVSQAGIAIGLALFAANRFPMYSSTIIAIALGTTIFTEIVGPILARFAIMKSGEYHKKLEKEA